MRQVCVTAFVVASFVFAIAAGSMPNVRPPPSQRQMNSTYINDFIGNVTRAMADPDLATLFSNCFPNTLDTTVRQGWSDNDTFIITGDIDAMWLRDSTNQVYTYLPFLNSAPELRKLIRGVVKRQQHSILIDSYANAFNFDANGNGHPTDLRDPPMTPRVFEGKYELDSVCAAIKLGYHYVNVTSDLSVLINDEDTFRRAARKMLETIHNATLGTTAAFMSNNDLPYYRFLRVTPWEYDVFPKTTSVPTVGLARSAFRPSDDSTMYDFLIPSNAMAVVELRHLSELCVMASKALKNDPEFLFLAERSMEVSDKIREAIDRYAVVAIDNGTSAMLAYEVDGLGHFNLMDDPNIPGLLSLPLIGAASFTSNVAPGTRGWLLSSSNPYYYCGTIGCGMGSPHTPPGWVWPMAVMVRALTSDNKTEVKEQLAILKASAESTGWMHESFNPSNATQFTRSWFAWANTLFGQTILDVGHRFPDLIYTHGVPPEQAQHYADEYLKRQASQ